MKRLLRTFPKPFLIKLALISVGMMLPTWWLLHISWPTFLDYILRGLMLNEASHQIWKGDWYPRWLVRANAGLGSPIMLFQPMTVIYAGAIFEPLARFDPRGYGRVLLSMSLLLFAGGLGCYRWLRLYFSDKQAQAGTVLYLTYFCAFSSMAWYNTGLMAQALMPFFLYIATRIASNPLKYVPHYALLQGLLCMTSPPYAFIFSGIPFFYAIISAPAGKRKYIALYAAIASCLGLMLACIYLIPLLANHPLIMFQFFTGMRINPFRLGEFLRSPRPMHIVLIFYVVAIIILIISYRRVAKQNPFETYRRELVFFIAVAAGSLFMTTGLSNPIWKMLPILQNLQHKERFMYTFAPAAVFIITCWLPKLPKYKKYYSVIMLVAFVLFCHHTLHHYKLRLNQQDVSVFYYKLVPQVSHNTRWMYNAGITDPMDPPRRFLTLPPVYVDLGEATIKHLKQRSDRIRFSAEVTSSQGAVVMLKRFYYPGWYIEADPPHDVTVGERDARLAVYLPKGKYRVTLKQPFMPGERVGNAISLAGILIIAGWAIVVHMPRKKKAISAN